MNEGEFDTPEIIEFHVQKAIENARQLEGWDIFATSREQNINLLDEDLRTVTARFFEEEAARGWARNANGDQIKIRRWFDERLKMPCFVATVTYNFPE